MSSILLIPPAGAPLSLAEARRFLRVETDEDDALMAERPCPDDARLALRARPLVGLRADPGTAGAAAHVTAAQVLARHSHALTVDTQAFVEDPWP